MHEIALSNQAAWFSFLTDLRAGNDLQRLSMADVFACTAKTQSRSSAVPGFRMIGVGLLGKLIGECYINYWLIFICLQGLIFCHKHFNLRCHE